MRKTKIICTIGPASSDFETMKAMVEAGMDVARLNFSHGDHSTHQQYINTLRQVSKELKHPIAILQDLQGPKIRVGEMQEGVVLTSGEKTIITMEDVVGTTTRFSSTYKGLAQDVKVNDPILINDGLLKLRVNEVKDHEIHCTVVYGGALKSHKGINLSQSSISTPPLTEKDLEDLEFGLSQDVDYIALSFVREAADLEKVRDIVKRSGKPTHVVAKVERHEAVEAMDDIVQAADVIMVARGDLGVEMLLEQVPQIQKSLIDTCRNHLKPVITATQMLESMIQNPRPTRAEVSDVANAILEGTDAIMLSGETSVGRYPVETVRTMARIAETTEARLTFSRDYIDGTQEHTISTAVGYSACQLAQNIKAKAIICFTEYGYSTRVLSKYRQSIPVIAVTPTELVQRRLVLYWGVQSLRLEEVYSTDAMIVLAEQAAVEHGFVNKGDVVVMIAGLPLAITGVTNLIKAHRIGEQVAV
ncbi:MULTISPECIES: pyruvate kinase [unclassified Coleofasciculus]|uniref:pyruvate kinase n=1 Tax=unclassified Coleofasciculus TaxID=2692782 RepID=UPI001880D37F|nr:MULTISPECIES: pyruvate kinase [unclassified Coleofasciculus]MBE9125122.1 pyruvate kinase [Coleofasciculus sp. LEGE 07081]MBE9148339.1 pyruvate kinase [Coleofasciculus sp. LEGE 07092]